MRRGRIGGELDLDALSRLHQPAYARAVADARDHLRRCLAAIAAAEHPNPERRAELVRMHARLADELVGLETLERRL